MNRASEQLAPPWLPRQQRCRVERELRKLLRRDVCSICGGTLCALIEKYSVHREAA